LLAQEANCERIVEGNPPNGRELRRLLRGSLARRVAVTCLLAVAPVGALIGYAASIAGLIGPFWPTDPEFHPRASFSGQLTDIAFEGFNPSTLFNIENATLICGVDQMWLEDADGRLFGASDAAFVTGKSSIPARGHIEYQCDASGLLQIRPDGGVTMRGALNSPPSNFRGPLKIKKMCLWVGVDYRLLGFDRKFRSTIFQWPASDTDHSWLNGMVARDAIRNLAGVNAVECSNYIRFPYILFNGPGPPNLILK